LDKISIHQAITPEYMQQGESQRRTAAGEWLQVEISRRRCLGRIGSTTMTRRHSLATQCSCVRGADTDGFAPDDEVRRITDLGIMAIPGIGPLVAAGWLATTFAGAGAGLLLVAWSVP
jgi:hypothetical protein